MQINRWFYRVSLMLLPQLVFALGNHPRIWLTPTLISSIQAKVNANDPDWQRLKATADTLKGYTVAPYDRNACLSNQICYNYEGLGWLSPMIDLALVYRVTGDWDQTTERELRQQETQAWTSLAADWRRICQSNRCSAMFSAIIRFARDLRRAIRLDDASGAGPD